jgi:hypothetical protein
VVNYLFASFAFFAANIPFRIFFGCSFVAHCYTSKFGRRAQISRCAKSKRAGFKPAPTNPDSFFAFFAPFVVNSPIPKFFGCGVAALGPSWWKLPSRQ